MAHRICHKCSNQGRLLPAVSQDAVVDYYRCDHCGHVWAHDKHNPNSKPRDITYPSNNRDD